VKLRKFLPLAIAAILVGCGHGFEGEYTEQSGSSNEFINAFAKAAGGETIVIGSNYIESNGKRTNFEDIFVRESGGQAYLIFKDKDSEEAWKIADKDTLIQGTDLVSVTLKRHNK